MTLKRLLKESWQNKGGESETFVGRNNPNDW